MKFISILFFAIFNFHLAYSQVTVDVNSGNPNFPFPQFLEYATGKTVGLYNPEGVTHCEMEATLREGWQIFANEFRYENTTVDGVRYIREI